MRVVAINEAEAVLEPFWDGGTSDFEDTDKRYCVLDEYAVSTAEGAVARMEQAWAWAQFTIDACGGGGSGEYGGGDETPHRDNSSAGGHAAAPVLTLSRTCDVDVGLYDALVLCGSIPQAAQLRVRAVLDGTQRVVLEKTRGAGATDEYTAPFAGARLTGLTLEIFADEPCSGNLAWIGAQHGARLSFLLQRKSPYDAQWPGFFTDACECKPELGLLFDAAELPALREKLSRPPFAAVMDEKRCLAQQALAVVPEQYIGRFVPHYDKRWCRKRDENRGHIHDMMENLAFVGLCDGNADYLKMACRHLLALCHCEYWCESMLGQFPGATWHHRCFTESFLARAAALVLDWCGSLLTPFAKQLVRDCLALKALPRMESDFRRIEYIRHMNQGIVFSGGRIYALLALAARHPRYEALLKEAEADVLEMIANYVGEDGGTLEGPGYWMFTFGDIMPSFYALARRKGRPFTDYRTVFAATGAFALGLMSLEDDGTMVLPLNDAHPNTHMSCSLASSFYAFTGDAHWRAIYETLLQKGLVDKDVFALISVPDGSAAALASADALADMLTGANAASPQAQAGPSTQSDLPRLAPAPALFVQTGHLGSVRTDGAITTHLHYCSGLAYRGHYHQDKGSFVLEANGTALCPDFGTGYYHEADLFGLTNPAAHSLLLPVYESGQTARQHAGAPCGTILNAFADNTSLHFYADETAAWSDSPFASCKRRITSPFATAFVIEDTYTLDKAQSAVFVLNGAAPYEIFDGYAQMHWNGLTLTVLDASGNWQSAACRPLADGERRPVHQLWAQLGSARAGTAATVLLLGRKTTLLQKTPTETTLLVDAATITVAHENNTVSIRRTTP